MNASFGFSADQLVLPLLVIAGVVLLVLVGLCWRYPYVWRIAIRNVPRRRMRTTLIIVGLMFATMFVAASLAVDDTITLAVKSVAVFNLGRIDEDILRDGNGLRLYDANFGQSVITALAHDSRVAGVAPTLVVPNMLVSDTASRQVRAGVDGVALDDTAAGPLADLRTLAGTPVTVADLASGEIYINRNTSLLLLAKPGDTVYLASPQWPGGRQAFRVKAIITGGLLSDRPSIVMPLPMLQALTTGAKGQINHIYVANAGDGLTGVANSDDIAHTIHRSTHLHLYVDTVKLDGVELAIRAQDIFGRIFSLYTLFALSVGLLLIGLIFVLLAAERRAELGTVRALGMRQQQVVLLLLLEGAVYDAAAAALGIAIGLGLGVAIITAVSPTIARIGFPLHVALNPGSMLFAFSLGFLFTLITIGVAAWVVSHMTVAAALRDLPEPPTPQPSLRSIAQGLASTQPRQIVGALGAVLRAALVQGIVPLAVGIWVLRHVTDTSDILAVSLGLSSCIVGGVLIVRWLVITLLAQIVRHTLPVSDGHIMLGRIQRGADRVVAVAIGGGLALYWALPFDLLQTAGFSRFSGGITIFFIAGVMMVFGTVMALAPNLDLIFAPLRWFLGTFGRLRHVTQIALIYPAFHRMRTGIGLALFALVCFTMVVMACIANSATHQYDNLPAQAAEYDIAGRPLAGSLGDVQALMKTLPNSSGHFDAVSSASSLLLGMFQPGADNARWHLYPAAQIDGAFLHGVGLPLVARAVGYSSDSAVWDAVRNQPGAVVIDASALTAADAQLLGVTQPATPGFAQYLAPPIVAGIAGFASVTDTAPTNIGQSYAQAAALANSDPSIDLRLQGIALGAGQIRPTALWVSDLRGNGVTKLTIVGIVENARAQRYGVLGSPTTFAPVEANLTPLNTPFYFFKVANGIDAHQEAQVIGSALFDSSFETTVLGDVLLDTNGARVFISRVLVGLVGLTLLVGMAALAVAGSRAVIERRQQIGMLRALGFRRWHVQMMFLIESLLVGLVGMLIGLVLGLILCRNVFAVDFFEPIQSGLTLIVPWGEVGLICAAALLASILASILPAWQAGRITPAEAIRSV